MKDPNKAGGGWPSRTTESQAPDQTSQLRFSPSEEALAQELLNKILLVRGQAAISATLTGFARSLRALVELDRRPEEEVRRVITWYVAQLGTKRKRLPDVRAPRTLREKYDSVRAAYEMDNPFPAVAPDQISADALSLEWRLWNLGWPPPAQRAQFPSLAHKVLVTITTTRAALLAKKKPPQPPLTLPDKALSFLLDRLAYPINHSLWWASRRHRRITRHDRTGDLSLLIPDPADREYRDLCTCDCQSSYGASAAALARDLLLECVT